MAVMAGVVRCGEGSIAVESHISPGSLAALSHSAMLECTSMCPLSLLSCPLQSGHSPMRPLCLGRVCMHGAGSSGQGRGIEDTSSANLKRVQRVAATWVVCVPDSMAMPAAQHSGAPRQLFQCQVEPFTANAVDWDGQVSCASTHSARSCSPARPLAHPAIDRACTQLRVELGHHVHCWPLLSMTKWLATSCLEHPRANK